MIAAGMNEQAAELAARWRRIAPTLEPGLRVAYLRTEVAARAVARVAAALDRICADAEQGRPGARELLVSVVDMLAESGFEAHAQLLREEAAGQSLHALGRLLRRAPPRAGTREPLRPSFESRVPDYGTGRQLTLGERKALARRPTRTALEKLLADPHPMVIRALLTNAKVVENDVVRLAARRPGVPEVLAEIGKSPRWAHRVRVRMALVLNPDSPSELAVPLVGLLVRPELKLVAESSEVPAVVRAAARDLLARRPPVRAPRQKPSLQ